MERLKRLRWGLRSFTLAFAASGEGIWCKSHPLPAHWAAPVAAWSRITLAWASDRTIKITSCWSCFWYSFSEFIAALDYQKGRCSAMALGGPQTRRRFLLHQYIVYSLITSSLFWIENHWFQNWGAWFRRIHPNWFYPLKISLVKTACQLFLHHRIAGKSDWISGTLDKEFSFLLKWDIGSSLRYSWSEATSRYRILRSPLDVCSHRGWPIRNTDFERFCLGRRSSLRQSA